MKRKLKKTPVGWQERHEVRGHWGEQVRKTGTDKARNCFLRSAYSHYQLHLPLENRGQLTVAWSTRVEGAVRKHELEAHPAGTSIAQPFIWF